jgi:hypothetical protein
MSTLDCAFRLDRAGRSWDSCSAAIHENKRLSFLELADLLGAKDRNIFDSARGDVALRRPVRFISLGTWPTSHRRWHVRLAKK